MKRNNSSNQFLNRIQVIPLTSNVSRCYANEALVDLNGKPSKAMADQLTTISELRLLNRAGSTSKDEMLAVEMAIKLQLDILDF